MTCRSGLERGTEWPAAVLYSLGGSDGIARAGAELGPGTRDMTAEKVARIVTVVALCVLAIIAIVFAMTGRFDADPRSGAPGPAGVNLQRD